MLELRVMVLFLDADQVSFRLKTTLFACFFKMCKDWSSLKFEFWQVQKNGLKSAFYNSYLYYTSHFYYLSDQKIFLLSRVHTSERSIQPLTTRRRLET